MLDLNLPPRLWKSPYLTLDLERVLAVLKSDDSSDLVGYRVYVETCVFTIGLKTGESLLKALEDYRSVKATELR